MDASNPASRSASPSPGAKPAAPPKHDLLNHGPLYAFALPRELLQLITLRSPLGGHAAAPATSNDQTLVKAAGGIPADSVNDVRSSTQAALACSSCGIADFEDIAEQRSHFSSDLHRYNVKRKLANKPPVDQQEWEQLVDGLSDSLTGTASATSDDSASEDSQAEDGDSDSAVARVFAKQRIANGGELAVDEEGEAALSPRSPLLWFEARELIKDTQFGIYRTIFPSSTSATGSSSSASEDPSSKKAAWLDELRSLQVSEDTSKLGKRARVEGGAAAASTEPSSRTWTLLAIGGGHFAGMIVSLVPKLHNRNGRIEKEVQVLQSKTFHRYTTRRKQGGAQSANDNAKGNAKSAGAQIRRYNEAMLRDEIRQLLASWREQIASSELIFVRASKTSQSIFYDYDEPVLQRRDPRMRTFPFPTRRPTQAELVRCFIELTRVKLSHFTDEELEEMDRAIREAAQPKKPPPPPQKKPKEVVDAPKMAELSKEEILERDKWTRMLDMVKKGRLEAFKGFLERQQQSKSEEFSGPDSQLAAGPGKWTGPLPEWTEERRLSPTLLHVAASSDQPEIVRYLLNEVKVDPTLSAFKAPSADDTEETSTAATAAGVRAPLPVRTAYECSASRSVRDVFRRAYADLPNLWDWKDGARVPSQLTEEAEAQQNAQKNEKTAKLRERMKQREAAREAELAAEAERERLAREAELRKQEEARRASTSTAPRRLGGAAPRAVQEQTQLRGLSEEAKMRIERERRARAAEARLSGR